MPIVAGVAVVDVVFIALVAAILLWATYQLFQPFINGALAQIPFGVGAWVGQQAANLLAAIWGAASGWANSSVQPLADATMRVYVSVAYWSEAVTSGLEDAAVMGFRIVYKGIIPGQVFLQTLITQVAQDLQANLNYVQAYLTVLIVSVAQNLQANLNYVQAYLTVLIVSVAQNLQANLNAVEANLRAQLGATATTLYNDLLAVDANLRAQLGAVSGYLEQLIGREAVIARDYTDARIGAAVGVLVPAIAAVESDIAKIEDRACMRYCNPLGNLGGLLQELEDIGMAAILVGLLAEGVSNPQGVLNELEAVGVPLVKDIAGGVESMAGVGAQG